MLNENSLVMEGKSYRVYIGVLLWLPDDELLQPREPQIMNLWLSFLFVSDAGFNRAES